MQKLSFPIRADLFVDYTMIDVYIYTCIHIIIKFYLMHLYARGRHVTHRSRAEQPVGPVGPWPHHFFWL